MKTTTHPARKLIPCCRAWFSFLLLSLLSTVLQAQVAYFGVPGLAGPLNTDCGPISRASAYSAATVSNQYYLYTAADMAAAGIVPGSTLTAIGWYKANAGATTPGNTSSIWRIHMKNTSTLSLPAWCNPSYSIQASGATLVYENLAQPIPGNPGWIVLNLTTPFVYTGGSLEVGSYWDCSAYAGTPTTDGFAWNLSATPAPNTTFGSSGSSSSLMMINESCSPIAQIQFSLPGACIQPAPGNTISSVSIGCTGTNCQLSLQNQTAGSGVTYQWQSCADTSFSSGVTSLGTTPAEQVSLSLPLYYRCVVTCNGSLSAISNPVFVDVYTPIQVFPAAIDLTCHGDNLGEIYLSVTGGTSPYTYSWNSGLFNTQNLTGLSAGGYQVQVTDINGCTATANAVVNEPPVLNASTISTNVSAIGLSNGSITINTTGGTPPYQYSIDGGTTYFGTNVFSGQSATQ